MGQQPEVTRTVIREFGGLVSNRDGADIDPGQARVQVNARAERVGELRPRLGWSRVTFED